MHSKMLMDIEKVQIHFGGSIKASSQMIRELLQAQCLSFPCYKRSDTDWAPGHGAQLLPSHSPVNVSSRAGESPAKEGGRRGCVSGVFMTAQRCGCSAHPFPCSCPGSRRPPTQPSHLWLAGPRHSGSQVTPAPSDSAVFIAGCRRRPTTRPRAGPGAVGAAIHSPTPTAAAVCSTCPRACTPPRRSRSP